MQSLISQNFVPIPADTNSEWRISREYNDESCSYHHNSIYYIDGTMIINGKSYYKIYEEGYYYESPTNPQYPCSYSYNYTGVFRGAIRTENGKTYGFSEGLTRSPELLMDFTLDVGDTLYSFICQNGKVIESIDSVLVGDEYRKRFNFTNSWYCSWMIEGIGHERGLFESMDDPFENSSTLICYGEEGIPLFGNQNCDITVGISEKSCMINKVIIYPNPTKNIITLNLSKQSLRITKYSISDIYGKMLLNKEVNTNNQKLIINLEEYKSGIYILFIKFNDKTFIVKKIIKK